MRAAHASRTGSRCHGRLLLESHLHGGAQVYVPAQPVDVVDTVGAGDTFNAGVLAKFSETGALDKSRVATLSPEIVKSALSFGAKVAGVTVSRAGANPPWAAEL